MAEKKLNAWKESLERDIGVKESIVIYGNVLDICRNQLNQKRYDSILRNVVDIVKEKDYKRVRVWDCVGGTNWELSKYRKNTPEQSPAPGGYLDADDDAFTQPSNISPTSGDTDVDNFFSEMLTDLNGATEPTAFILDYSDYLFGNSNSLSEKERMYLAKIAKTLQAQQYDIAGEYFRKPRNLVIILTKNQSSIPPICYLDNPQVSSINIPYPGRPERSAFVDYVMPNLNVSKSLNSPENKLDKENFIDSLDGFSLKEIAQLVRLSGLNGEPLSCEKLVNLYKYGEKISPWEELNREKLENIDETLKKRVKGQDEAIEKVRSVILRAYTGFSGLQHSAKQRKPKGTLFFVGPTGVGKTELAKAIAEFIFGDEGACIRFDMSEFSQEHSDQRLIGAPPGYVGYEAGGQLTNAVMAKPFCVLLFDEIEKAHGRILDKFLQILEDGRLTDSKGQTVSFSETIIIFTSNIGAANGSISPDMAPEEVHSRFEQEVKRHFVEELKRPELLNRIGDNIVPFNFINDKKVFVNIAKTKMRPMIDFMKDHYQAKLRFEDEDVIFSSIAEVTDARNGGRGLLNVIESRIVNKLADFVFEHTDELEGRTIVVSTRKERPGRFELRLE